MGTNYYVKVEQCACCGHGPTRVHIGKSSWPWKFLFRWNPQLYKSWDDLRVWLLDKELRDDYDRVMSYGDFVHLVESKQHNTASKSHMKSHDNEIKIIDGYEFYDRDFS